MVERLALLDRPGDFIGGRFVVSDAPDELLEVRSPADLDDVVAVHAVSIAHVDDAVKAARGAFPAWRRLGLDARAKLLRAYQERVRHHAAAFTELLAREAGKARWDAASEAGALAAKVDLVLGEGAEWTRDRRLDDLPGEIRFRPHGVLAVLGPFNFPVHLPNGQILPALLLGNTVVFKPSEKCPSAAVLMMRCFEEAGFPPGVVNLVQGGAKSAVALSGHADVDGILFTGSVPVGKAIVAANAARPGRLVALELGGKNASIVLEDADVEAAARHIAFAAYASAGQRCTATSRVFVARAVADQLVERFADAARRVVVGHPLTEGVFMGPLIAASSKAALLEAQGRARAAGFEAVVEGGDFDAGKRGHYVRPSVHLAPRADVRVEGYTHDELFGPDVAVYVVDDLDQAIALANDTEFGLASAVFTASEASFEKAADELRVGVLHWNQSSNGASGRLPFGGVKNSGNHRPAGITAGSFCAYPLAVRHAPPADAPLPSWPGLFG
ncbi:MAG: aldehyde dehydrogenase family protein [Sandaracinus sp.]|nr:aldehyde dehydrogenase family protein [Sandaracinus sp.]